MLKISETYEIWNETSLESGETDNRGYSYRDTEMTFAELVRTIRLGGFSQPSNTSLCGSFWLSDPDGKINYKTGEVAFSALHFSDIERKRKYFRKAFLFVYGKRG